MAATRRVGVLVVIAVAGVIYLVVRSFLADQDVTEARGAAEQSEQSKRYTAEQFLQACRATDQTAPELAEACRIAANVATKPPARPAPPPEPEDGRDGIGIADVQPGDCSVTIRLTDGRSRTIDDLCGKDGRGVASTDVDGCYVTVSFTDDTDPARLGPFCGGDGKDGADGKDGKDGKDGQSPACLSEPNQCRGADGDKGDPGQKGDKGEPGEPGPACPEGYEPRPAVITAPDGSTYQGVACVDPATSEAPDEPPLGG